MNNHIINRLYNKYYQCKAIGMVAVFIMYCMMVLCVVSLPFTVLIYTVIKR